MRLTAQVHAGLFSGVTKVERMRCCCLPRFSLMIREIKVEVELEIELMTKQWEGTVLVSS
jgi:hypothetical protein